jgi:hypothetical protein
VNVSLKSEMQDELQPTNVSVYEGQDCESPHSGDLMSSTEAWARAH